MHRVVAAWHLPAAISDNTRRGAPQQPVTKLLLCRHALPIGGFVRPLSTECDPDIPRKCLTETIDSHAIPCHPIGARPYRAWDVAVAPAVSEGKGSCDRHVPPVPGRARGVYVGHPGRGKGLESCSPFALRGEASFPRMNRFVGTFTNKIDAKGRVSIPAPYRVILERDGYAGGIYCYPSLDAPAIDAGGERLAQTIDRLLGS